MVRAFWIQNSDMVEIRNYILFVLVVWAMFELELELGFCSKNLTASFDIFEKYVFDPKFNNSKKYQFYQSSDYKDYNFSIQTPLI